MNNCGFVDEKCGITMLVGRVTVLLLTFASLGHNTCIKRCIKSCSRRINSLLASLQISQKCYLKPAQNFHQARTVKVFEILPLAPNTDANQNVMRVRSIPAICAQIRVGALQAFVPKLGTFTAAFAANDWLSVIEVNEWVGRLSPPCLSHFGPAPPWSSNTHGVRRILAPFLSHFGLAPTLSCNILGNEYPIDRSTVQIHESVKILFANVYFGSVHICWQQSKNRRKKWENKGNASLLVACWEWWPPWCWKKKWSTAPTFIENVQSAVQPRITLANLYF